MTKKTTQNRKSKGVKAGHERTDSGFFIGNSDSAMRWGDVPKSQEELVRTIEQARAELEKIRSWSFLTFIWRMWRGKRYKVINSILNDLTAETQALSITSPIPKASKKK